MSKNQIKTNDQVKITKICIKNIKGWGERKELNVEIFANKPNILVAPNGFGKSSLRVAFEKLKSNRIDLNNKQDSDDKSNYYKEDTSNLPYLSITYQTEGRKITLEADSQNNGISKTFDICIIKNRLKVGVQRYHTGGDFFGAKGKFSIDDIELLKYKKEDLNYKVTNIKKKLSKNNQNFFVNLSEKLQNNLFMSNIELLEYLKYIKSTKTDRNKIENFLQTLDSKIIQKEDKIEFLAIEMEKFNEDSRLIRISNLIRDFFQETEEESFLIAIQLYKIYEEDPKRFQAYHEYRLGKVKQERLEEMFKSFAFGGHTLKTQKDNKNNTIHFKLKIENPQIISYGQRDSLVFLAELARFGAGSTKEHNLLIIDEVFDCLDEANFVVMQYYITKYIEIFKKKNKKFYPIILTHLNPEILNTFCFGEKKVSFLGDYRIGKNNASTMIINRKEIENKENAWLSKYFLHYHPEDYQLKEEDFTQDKSIKIFSSYEFYEVIHNETTKYLNSSGEKSYCPLCVCCSVRVKIEEKLYESCQNENDKDEFLGKHRTLEKIKCIQEKIEIPEVYSLLGILYNQGAHFKYEGEERAIFNILQNLSIKGMIKNIFEEEESK